ncbi:MAG: YkgJ family cysteine cluster protein [archaeon]
MEPDLVAKCDRCGDCCRTQKIPFNLADIFGISAHLKMAPDDFVERYLELIADKEGELAYVIKEKLCPFLIDNLCSVEEIKPTVCRTTPCPKNEGYREFSRKYGAMTLQFLQNSASVMITHGLNVEYTQDYLERHKKFDEHSAMEYRQKIEADLKNKLLSWMLLKNMVAVGVHPKYHAIILDKLKRKGIIVNAITFSWKFFEFPSF